MEKKFLWFSPLKIELHYHTNHIKCNIFNQVLLYVLIFVFHKFLILLKIIYLLNNRYLYFRILLFLTIINVKVIKNDVMIETSSNEVKTFWNFLFHFNSQLKILFKRFHHLNIQMFSFHFVSHLLNVFYLNLFDNFYFHQNIYLDLFFKCLKFKIIRIRLK